MITASVCSVRIPRNDSQYVSITCVYTDDTSKLFFADGDKYESTIITRENFEKDKDRYAIGARVRLWYSSSVKDGKTRWFTNIEPA